MPVLALPLMAGFAGACSADAPPPANLAPMPSEKASLTPEEAAQAAVRASLEGAGDLRFVDTNIFSKEGEQVVCGRVERAGQPAQRYISVDGEFVFVESRMEPGHMDRAYAEFCRNA